MYLSKVFWASTAERAIKTIAQTAVGILTAGATGLLDVDWIAVLSVSLLAGLISILTSVAGSQAGTVGDPSLVGPDLGDLPEVVADEEFEFDPDRDAGEVDLTPVPDDYQPRH